MSLCVSKSGHVIACAGVVEGKKFFNTGIKTYIYSYYTLSFRTGFQNSVYYYKLLYPIFPPLPYSSPALFNM